MQGHIGRARKIEFQHGCSYKTLCVQTAWDLLVLGARGGMNAVMLSWRSGSGVVRSFPQPFKISLFLGGWGKHETCKTIAIVDARAVADSVRRSDHSIYAAQALIFAGGAASRRHSFLIQVASVAKRASVGTGLRTRADYC